MTFIGPKNTLPNSVNILNLVNNSVIPEKLDLSTQSNLKVKLGTKFGSLSTNVWSKIPFGYVERDIRKEYDAANAQFIAEKSGTYSFTVSLELSSSHLLSTNIILQVAIYRNGALYEVNFQDVHAIKSGFNPVKLFTNHMALNAGDTISIYVNTDTSGTSIEPTQSTFLKGAKVL